MKVHNQLTFLTSRSSSGSLKKIIIIWGNLKIVVEPEKIIEHLKKVANNGEIQGIFNMIATIKGLENGIDCLLEDKSNFESTVAESRKLFNWYFKQFDQNLATNIKKNMKNFETIEILTTKQNFNGFTDILRTAVNQHKISLKIKNYKEIEDINPIYGRMLDFIMRFVHSDIRGKVFALMKRLYEIKTGNNMLNHPVWREYIEAFRKIMKRREIALLKARKAELKRRREVVRAYRRITRMLEERYAQIQQLRNIIHYRSPAAG